jgi:hypothetical protein
MHGTGLDRGTPHSRLVLATRYSSSSLTSFLAGGASFFKLFPNHQRGCPILGASFCDKGGLSDVSLTVLLPIPVSARSIPIRSPLSPA